ncbi:M43 family zinc metalloprotease [Cytophaga aurantiaca]|uniref:M43 family zinc metalloprotease n=1 Tax=Cytophaga aurantiaca TaxID=29530 RepID=UPI00036984E9|nr:zinc-dependent metalloprotease family protein [Cytophaga aurantiaca]
MKKLILFNVALALLVNLAFLNSSKASVQGDSIKPLPQIGKEFLVVVHIVRDPNGIAGISEAQINSTINSVNTIFAPITAKFTVCEFRYIDNFQYNNLIFQENISLKKKELDPLYRLQHRINMFFVTDPDMIENKTCGYATFGGIAETGSIVIKKSCANVVTIGHELGHFFGLNHTFEGNTASLIVQRAFDENCKTTGDGFCDTPADPYVNGDDINLYVDANCNYKSTKVDQIGNTFAPDVTNIMSYYTSCIIPSFTLEQYAYMANYYNTHLGTW